MPLKNKLTLAAFIAKFSSEKAFHEYLAKKRWPNGFVCPSCKGTHGWMLADGKYECSRCFWNWKQQRICAKRVLPNLQSPPFSKVLPSTQTDTAVIKKACLVMNISRKFTIRTRVCCIGCMGWLAMQRLLYLEHFTDCPRRISTSTCWNSALGSTVETWICLNAWLSRFVAHFYLTKRDNQIIK